MNAESNDLEVQLRDMFSIDSETGSLKFNRSPPENAVGLLYKLVVQASDRGQPAPLYNRIIVCILIADEIAETLLLQGNSSISSYRNSLHSTQPHSAMYIYTITGISIFSLIAPVVFIVLVCLYWFRPNPDEANKVYGRSNDRNPMTTSSAPTQGTGTVGAYTSESLVA